MTASATASASGRQSKSAASRGQSVAKWRAAPSPSPPSTLTSTICRPPARAFASSFSSTTRCSLASPDRINNWDLIDGSAPQILGGYLADRPRPRKVLYTLANSGHLWKKRMAMMATLHFIRDHDFDDAFAIAELLRQDGHDLIHKVVGWMLREIGNRDPAAERAWPASSGRWAIAIDGNGASNSG